MSSIGDEHLYVASGFRDDHGNLRWHVYVDRVEVGVIELAGGKERAVDALVLAGERFGA